MRKEKVNWVKVKDENGQIVERAFKPQLGLIFERPPDEGPGQATFRDLLDALGYEHTCGGFEVARDWNVPKIGFLTPVSYTSGHYIYGFAYDIEGARIQFEALCYEGRAIELLLKYAKDATPRTEFMVKRFKGDLENLTVNAGKVKEADLSELISFTFG